MKENSNIKVYLAAILYSIITGFSFLFGKIALDFSNPMDILAYRFTASFIAILIPIMFKWVKLNYNRDKVIRIFPLAILYPLLFFGFQTFGLKYASSSEAGIMQASAPIFTLVLASYFLKEKTNTLQKLSIILSVVGVVYIVIMTSSSIEFTGLKGILLLLFSALSFAGYSVLARILTRDFNSLELSYLMIIISFIAFTLIALIRNITNNTINDLLVPLKSIGFILSILYLGVLSSFGTSLLTNYILSKIEASKMSVFSNLGTIISILAGGLILQERIYYYHIIGSIFIVAGVLGTNFLDSK